MKNNKFKISIIGLGKLGSPMLAIFAEKGFKVIGVDLNSKIVDSINSGIAPFNEPLLQDLLTNNKGNYSATTKINEAVEQSDICFIIVPTPSGKNNFFKNDYVISAVESIGEALKNKKGYMNIVITSTVMPGSTGSVIKNALEKESNRKIGEDLGLCYNPEFIALGSVVRDMLNPDMLLIGESDQKAGDMLEEIYINTVESDPVCHRMNWINAELCKLAVNTFVTTKISYANMISDMCDHLQDADVDVVTNALGSDSRIGKKYLKGGVAFGGPCFPRDNKAFVSIGDNLGVKTDLAKATDSINDYQTDRLLNLIKSYVPKGSIISILGLAYKPNTPVIDESPGLALAKRLISENFIIRLTDPQGVVELKNNIDLKNASFLDFQKAINGAHTIVVMTPWKDYFDIDFSKLEISYIIDPWRIFEESKLPSKITLIQPGIGNFFPYKNLIK